MLTPTVSATHHLRTTSLSPRHSRDVLDPRLHQSLSPRVDEAVFVTPPPLAIKLKRINSSAASTRTPSSRQWGVIAATPRKMKRRLIGLQNYGNTCFCNVILQGLLSCEEYCRYWLKRSSSYYNPASEYKGTLLRAWVAFLREVYTLEGDTDPHDFHQDLGRSLQELPKRADDYWAPRSHREVVGSHRRLLELIRLYNPQFPLNMQGDAHEFLQVLLKGLSTETHRSISTSISTRKSTTDSRTELISETESMFRFHFVSEIQCLNCDRRRRRYEAEYEWDVELPEQARVDLEQLFWTSAASRQVVRLHCSRCKSSQPSCLTRRPHKLPDRYICVQIKRFAYSRDSKQTYRLSTAIDLPKSRIVDFGVYCSDKQKCEDQFELFGMTLQSGSLETGHYSGMYLANRRSSFKHGSSSPEPQWFHFSDERVTGINSSDIENFSDSIYLLWFRRARVGWKASRSSVFS